MLKLHHHHRWRLDPASLHTTMENHHFQWLNHHVQWQNHHVQWLNQQAKWPCSSSLIFVCWPGRVSPFLGVHRQFCPRWNIKNAEICCSSSEIIWLVVTGTLFFLSNFMTFQKQLGMEQSSQVTNSIFQRGRYKGLKPRDGIDGIWMSVAQWLLKISRLVK